jgi:hypothetical protein
MLEEEQWYVKNNRQALFMICLPSKDTITYRIERMEPLRVAEVTTPLGNAEVTKSSLLTLFLI